MHDYICSVDGCIRAFYAREFCQVHYERDRRVRSALGPCSVDGCDLPCHARGMCARHYKRLLTTGTLELRKSEPLPKCSAADCARPVYTRNTDLCQMHHRRFVKFGSINRPARATSQSRWSAENASWRGEAAGYHAIHIRLRHLRGPASQHTCIDCGSRAAQWSYNHASDREQVEDGKPFTTDLEHYFPRCVPCHKRFDLGREDSATI